MVDQARRNMSRIVPPEATKPTRRVIYVHRREAKRSDHSYKNRVETRGDPKLGKLSETMGHHPFDGRLGVLLEAVPYPGAFTMSELQGNRPPETSWLRWHFLL